MRIELQSSVLHRDLPGGQVEAAEIGTTPGSMNDEIAGDLQVRRSLARGTHLQAVPVPLDPCDRGAGLDANAERSEEHTSELQSLMRSSYAVFCLKKKKKRQTRSWHHKTAASTQTRSKESNTPRPD